MHQTAHTHLVEYNTFIFIPCYVRWDLLLLAVTNVQYSYVPLLTHSVTVYFHPVQEENSALLHH